MLPPRLILVYCLALVCAPVPIFAAGDDLAIRIDQLIEAGQIGPVAPPAGDAEFFRRLSLDLHGVIPTSTDARQFLDDPTANKREVLVDRLLSSPRFAIHMAGVFDLMLMERRADKHVTTPEWQRYLQNAFEKNVPYDQLAREILSADGSDPNLRPAAKFFLDRDAEPHVMTRDVGRMFFGMDLQCAQCHDHPLVEHYLQTDYYGLFAFVNRTVVFADGAAKKSFLGEKSDGEASYKSVFTQDAGSIRPQLPGENETDEPRFRQGEDYLVAPLPNVRPIPKYSRRAKLAELATNGANRQFNVNIANRLWAHMMGRGLVHPVDLHHPLNPPSQAAVLELITNEFVAMKYDMRQMLRELARTKIYQRSIDAPTGDLGPQLAAAAGRLPADTTEYTALKSAAEESRKAIESAQAEFKAARAVLAPIEAAWRTAETAVTTAKKPLDDSAAAVSKSQGEANAKQTAIQAINEASAKSTEVAKLLPNDKEVAAAVATFTAKQQQLTTELTAIQKTIADLVAAQPPLQAKVVESYGPADTAFAAYAEARKPVDAAKAKLISAWNQHKASAFAAAVRKKQLDADQAHVAYQTALAKVATDRASVDQKKALADAAANGFQQQQLQVATLTNALAEIDKMSADAGKQLDDAKAQLAAKQTVVQAVSDAVSKTEAALQKLPDDADLKVAAQKLKERLESLAKESAPLEQAVATRDAAMKEVAAKSLGAKQALDAGAAEMAKRQQMVTAATNDVNLALASVREAESAVALGSGQLLDQWTAQGGVHTIKQISPEQLGWTIMQATGVIEGQRTVADAEVEKTTPKATVAADPAQARIREIKVQQQLAEQMRGHVAQFVGLYAASAGQPQDDFFATPDQALFVANGPTVNNWSQGGELSQRLAPLTDPKAFADELYLSVLTRRPTENEIHEAAQYLASHAAERPQAIRDLIWSLLTSAEFRFNH